MGIPNLSRDLEPYQEEIILGKGNIESKATSIQSIVIDGPALVYFLYYRLLSSTESRVLHALDAQPSYQQICQAATTFLVALQGNEVGVYTSLKFSFICYLELRLFEQGENLFRRGFASRKTSDSPRENGEVSTTPRELLQDMSIDCDKTGHAIRDNRGSGYPGLF